MKEIRNLFLNLARDLDGDIVWLILTLFDPGEFLSHLLKEVVSNMRKLNVLYYEEYQKSINSY